VKEESIQGEKKRTQEKRNKIRTSPGNPGTQENPNHSAKKRELKKKEAYLYATGGPTN